MTSVEDRASAATPERRRRARRARASAVPARSSGGPPRALDFWLGPAAARPLRTGPAAVTVLIVCPRGHERTLLNVFGPRVLGHGDRPHRQRRQDHGAYHFGNVGTGVLFEALALYVGRLGLRCPLSAYTRRRGASASMCRLRGAVEDKIQRPAAAATSTTQSRGDLLSRVTNDIDNIAQSLQQTLSQMLTSILLLIVGVAIMMFTISPLLAVVALTTVPLSVFAMRKSSRPGPGPASSPSGAAPASSTPRSRRPSPARHRQSFGHHEVEARFPSKNDELYESSFGAQFMSSLMQPATMFLGNVQYVIVAVVGGLRVASGAISVGDVQAFIQYSRTFSMPLTQLAA